MNLVKVGLSIAWLVSVAVACATTSAIPERATRGALNRDAWPTPELPVGMKTQAEELGGLTGSRGAVTRTIRSMTGAEAAGAS
jgi:hypothetical protein